MFDVVVVEHRLTTSNSKSCNVASS